MDENKLFELLYEIQKEIKNLKVDMKHDISSVKSDINGVKSDINSVKSNIDSIKSDTQHIRIVIDRIEHAQENVLGHLKIE